MESVLRMEIYLNRSVVRICTDSVVFHDNVGQDCTVMMSIRFVLSYGYNNLVVLATVITHFIRNTFQDSSTLLVDVCYASAGSIDYI